MNDQQEQNNKNGHINKVNKNNKKKPTPDNDKWVEDLIISAKYAIKGYESYLLDEINYNDLAKLMTKMRKVLEDSGKYDNINKDDKEN